MPTITQTPPSRPTFSPPEHVQLALAPPLDLFRTAQVAELASRPVLAALAVKECTRLAHTQAMLQGAPA
eukprot:CAMPEP_0177256976 /NCGR_PEP_ID=MMETSP0367-20130122/57257_1 /TAXON_ID=447022 ORGANISM="Scrippsiella hangoei-like, Strain SHHI-4" /NCGR_SAMPLE_ID=MMETSP0367 /ASSEMBLY_ACC=CAM_ASM_000362 /LENGTH=68 /DNA_ID=CAMNT_0018710953 /DNA_START=57 /DNA_END=260 /DNA_ORIENTATION=+